MDENERIEKVVKEYGDVARKIIETANKAKRSIESKKSSELNNEIEANENNGEEVRDDGER